MDISDLKPQFGFLDSFQLFSKDYRTPSQAGGLHVRFTTLFDLAIYQRETIKKTLVKPLALDKNL